MQTLHSADFHSATVEPVFRTPIDDGYLGHDYHRVIDWAEVRKGCNQFGVWLCKTAPILAVVAIGMTCGVYGGYLMATAGL